MEASAYLFIVNIPHDQWSAAIVRMEQTIGRGPDSSISIPVRFRDVSRRHAEIWSDASDQLFMRDLGSRCGTQVNGIQLKPHEQYAVVVGDRIKLGGLELQVAASLAPLPQIVAELSVPNILDTWDVLEMESSREDARELLSKVSNAELEVILWLCRGYTQLEAIGRKLHRSPHTVRTQLNSIFRKLNVHSRDELIGKLRRASCEQGSGSMHQVASAR
jgi:DNA-binding CsgD family transcriptional regulator